MDREGRISLRRSRRPNCSAGSLRAVHRRGLPRQHRARRNQLSLLIERKRNLERPRPVRGLLFGNFLVPTYRPAHSEPLGHDGVESPIGGRRRSSANFSEVSDEEASARGRGDHCAWKCISAGRGYSTAANACQGTSVSPPAAIQLDRFLCRHQRWRRIWPFDFSAPFSTGSFNTSGGLVGGTLGYNWQMGQAVFGLEGDADWSDIRGSAVCGGGVTVCEMRNDWLGTFRGRLGYAFDRFLPYVTGGLAVGDIKTSIAGLGAQTTPKQVGRWGRHRSSDRRSMDCKVEYLMSILVAEARCLALMQVHDEYRPCRVDLPLLTIRSSQHESPGKHSGAFV